MSRPKNFLTFSFQKLHQKTGAALITVLAVSTILLALIQNVWRDSRLEYSSSHQQLSELRSRYSARSGMELSLLRLSIYKEIGDLVKANEQVATVVKPYIDLLWSIPFMWPLSVPEDMSDIDKKSIQDLMKKSFLKESYSVSIIPEDGRLDINDLSTPIEYLNKFTFNTFLNLLFLSVEGDPKLKDKYDVSALRIILNNISDWTDLDNNSQNGGSEESIEDGKYPLNRSFLHIEEIQKVPGVTKDIYNILKPHITAYGSKGLNLNYASKEILQALNIPEIIVDEIRRRTTIGSGEYAPFHSQKSFCEYLTQRGLDLCEQFQNEYETLEMLQFNTVSHFRIEGSASSKKITTYGEALIYDHLQAVENYKKSVTLQNDLFNEESDDSNKDFSKKTDKKKPKKIQKIPRSIVPLPFTIIYWKESL